MKRIILESPFVGDVEGNIEYARLCVRDSLMRGEAPIASHLLYTQDKILNDNIPEERDRGIRAGLAWKKVADLHVFYVDKGMSPAMKIAMGYANEKNIPTELRYLFSSSIKRASSRWCGICGESYPNGTAHKCTWDSLCDAYHEALKEIKQLKNKG